MLVLRSASVVVNTVAVPFEGQVVVVEVVLATEACGDSPRREVRTSSSEALLGERSITKWNGRIVQRIENTLLFLSGDFDTKTELCIRNSNQCDEGCKK